MFGSFETFVRPEKDKGGEHQFVTLVWTNKDISLDATFESVQQQIARKNDSRQPEVHILHHGSSEDLVKYAGTPKKSDARDIRFMRATISGPKYNDLRGIVSDDTLVDALFDELSARIPPLNTDTNEVGKRPLIVVITESDTQYSRDIFNRLKDRFINRADLQPCSYLRGLDGRLENALAKTEAGTSESNVTVDSIFQGRGIAEKSSGSSQFDYLRRLAFHLELQTKKISGRDVAAVGILGSDIYDKMLVLQAVRPALPAAIFFTTDLDAIYLEQEHQLVTRNLVVASADGLEVKDELPPMRDSYQTVLAKKIRKLLPQPTSTPGPTFSSGSISTSQPTATPILEAARVFEIASGKSVLLEAPDNEKWNSVLRLLSVPYFSPFIFFLALGNGFLVLAAIFTLYSDQPKGPAISASARNVLILEVGIAFLAIIGLLAGLVYCNTSLLGEPVAFGISIWPSVMIRLVAFVVAILLLGLASLSFVAERRRVQGKLIRALRHSGMTHDFKQEFRLYLAKFFGSEKRPGWRPVLQNERFRRIVRFSLAYFLISILLFWISPPSVPGRGALALLSEKIILALGVALYIIHLVFCLELHLGAFRLLRALRLSCESANWQVGEVGKKAKLILEATGTLTSVIGKTLLYPLTVLILIILSRLHEIDNWVMAPSLGITFALGALLLVVASLVLWLRGSRLRTAVLEKHDKVYEQEESKLAEQISDESEHVVGPPVAQSSVTPETATDSSTADLAKKKKELATAFGEEKKELAEIETGVFAAWYSQPIFAAIFSAAAVFGSLTVAGPLARLFLS